MRGSERLMIECPAKSASRAIARNRMKTLFPPLAALTAALFAQGFAAISPPVRGASLPSLNCASRGGLCAGRHRRHRGASDATLRLAPRFRPARCVWKERSAPVRAARSSPRASCRRRPMEAYSAWYGATAEAPINRAGSSAQLLSRTGSFADRAWRVVPLCARQHRRAP